MQPCFVQYQPLATFGAVAGLIDWPEVDSVIDATVALMTATALLTAVSVVSRRLSV